MREQLKAVVNFLVWARENGIVLGQWDGDGQMTEADEKEIVTRYGVWKGK